MIGQLRTNPEANVSPSCPGGRRVRVAIAPAAELARRPRLWQALSAAFSVEFVPHDGARSSGVEGAGCAALIAHGIADCDLDGELASQPVLVSAGREESPAGETGDSLRVALASGPELDRRLRGLVLSDDRCGTLPGLRCEPGETALARNAGRALWTLRQEAATVHRTAALPAELGPNETLRERLQAGRFVALLPLIVLLREVTKSSAWTPPPLRATFMFDDPNLHRASYGYLDFAELARRAERSRFHVALATVPLDARFASRRAVDLLRRSATLSLLVHGNDHTWCELGRADTERAALALVAQASRRIGAFERRTGLAVAKVMAPPHGHCSAEVFGGLRRLGFLAACISRPYPWLEQTPADRPLARWEPADVVDGMGVLPRYSLTRSREDIPLRAFLDQPLVLYGHHGDLAGRADLLEEIASEVNRLGEVSWRDIGAIARSSFLTRREGALLRVRMLTRTAEVQVPAGIERVSVELGGSDAPGAIGDAKSGRESFLLVRSSGVAAAHMLASGASVEVAEGELLGIRASSKDHLDPHAVPAARTRVWPRARRLLVEGRDRLAPAIDSARPRRTGGR